MTIKERLNSRKLWAFAAVMVSTGALVYFKHVPSDTWKDFLFVAGVYIGGQGIQDTWGRK